MIIVCPNCGERADKPTGAVNRARKIGAPVYCGRECHGLARRVDRADDERRAMKAEYDRVRRAELADRIRAEKRAAYRRDHAAHLARMAALRADPAYRARMKAYQHAYVRIPEKKIAKKVYDRRWRAVREFGDGDAAEAMIALCELSEVLRPSKHENMASKGRINLCLNRKRRAYAKS